jgi:cytochrome c biogenesis protein CcmG/thiol:disulfide interchange protein DsbE
VVLSLYIVIDEIGGGRMIKKIFPFAIFLIFLGFLARGLQLNPKEMPSALVGKTITQKSFKVYPEQSLKTFQDWSPEVLIIHFWATWCDSCQQDVIELEKLHQMHLGKLIGVYYKDKLSHLRPWQTLHPKLFDSIILDKQGRLGMELGVVATPETFIVDTKGVIRYRYQGPLSDDLIQKEILPLLRQLH